MVRGILVALLALGAMAPLVASAAEPQRRVELNALEEAEGRCRITFVIENKAAALESLKLDLVVFDTEGVVHRRIMTEMAPMRAGRTIVRIFAIDTKCPRIGAVLVNDIAACVPGEPDACLDGLALASRVKDVRLYK